MQKLYKTKKSLFYTILIVVFLVYLFLALRPGVWDNGVFLFKQSNGTYTSDKIFDIHMIRTHLGTVNGKNQVQIQLSINDLYKNYIITSHEDSNAVVIYDGNNIMFKGHSKDGELFTIMGPYGTVSHTVRHVPQKEDYLPSADSLYEWATSSGPRTRGNLIFVPLVVLVIAYIIIDLEYPTFFFRMRYFFSWDIANPEPSDVYFYIQQIYRVVNAVLVVIFMLATFATQ